MRFHRVHVDAFGTLRDLDTGPEGLPGLVVVQGSNEAGKSTFFEFLVALLYGFYPASRDANPWAPWDHATASGEAWLRMDDGACWEVHRRLLSTPAGSLVRASVEEPLRNQTLACVAHVPRRVFRQVYALTLQELASLDSEGWAAVQDRLIGALGARDVRPARRVADELEAEAGALWRPNRRGRQGVRELSARMRELSYRRTRARDEERRARAVRLELDEAAEGLEGLRMERELCRARLEQARSAAPTRQRRARIRELEGEVGPAEAVADLPDDPVTRLAELRRGRDDGAERLHRLRIDRRTPEAALAAFDARQRALRDHEADIEVLATRAATAEPDRIRIGQLEQEVRDLTRRLETTLDMVPADRRPTPAAVERVRAADLRRALLALRRADDDRRRLLARQLDITHAAGGAALLLASAVLAGTLLAVMGIVVEVPPLSLAGTAIVVVGGAAAAALIVSRRRSEGAARREAEALDREARRQAGELLDPIGVSPDGALSSPELPAILERARDLIRDIAERTGTLERIRADLEELIAAVDELRRALPHEDDLPDDPGLTVHVLRSAAREASRRAEAARAAERERERLLVEEGRVATGLERHTAELDALETRLRALGDGDVERGAAEARRRLAARARVRELKAELERAEVGSPVPVEAEHDEVAPLAAREQELTELVESLAERVQGLRKDLEHLGRRETLDDIDGEVQGLEEERAQLVRRRDRLHVIARVVRDADRWVREEHQPEALRRAGAHLATLTAGRYDRLLVGGDDGRSFLVRGPGLRHAIGVDRPLSTGTREQVYLALRLALLDALDGRGERLPLVLDEVMVNWDPERRERGLDLLADIAEHRQVLLFTCHPDLAEACRRRGAGLIRLGAP
jgi:uncharacterized protein YhaN